MAGRITRAKGKGKVPAARREPVPEVYQNMLAEVLPTHSEAPERPLKRRRTGRRAEAATSSVKSTEHEDDVASVETEDDIQFEDVLEVSVDQGGDDLNTSDDDFRSRPKTQQTAYRDSDDDSDSTEDGFDWEGLKFGAKDEDDEPSGDLELTLTTQNTPQPKMATARRKAIGKVEKDLRLQIHKMHVLCLLSHVDRRNEWCNDKEIQRILKPLLTKKMTTFLRPKSDLSQFGQAESLKRGLDQVNIMWRTTFHITRRGLRRPLWADEEEHLQNYKLPEDADPPFEKSDFKAAAKALKGSRDLGVQLYCALLRSAGVDARLVCSLQPLTFTSGGPAMPKSSAQKKKKPVVESSNTVEMNAANFHFATPGESSSASPLSARRRLGHPSAAAYQFAETQTPSRPPPIPKSKEIHESAFPVFWVEVLDEAHQKWFPVDPLVTETIAKPRAFEPPAADRENNMSYVVAFEDEGSARDVTRRYAKAYNAKTRRNRVESTDRGERWWKLAMKPYSRDWDSDLDQIENTELAANEAREPMPKNVVDFKDHPYYALERHLRRNEILTSIREVGKVAAGRDPSGPPGKKKLESVFRRRDVKLARSADAWYRLGRDVKMGEQPAKIVPARRRPDRDMDEDQMEESANTNLYTEDQTELYVPPPIVNGRVPKNSFGNIDIYVPSMIPRGGVHLAYAEASRAARILGIDYADALTGFEFRGRHGTAVLKGVVVAAEYKEAVEAVIEGFRDEQARAEEEMRTLAALRMWKRFLVGLRIKERVDTYEVEGEEVVITEEKEQDEKKEEMDDHDLDSDGDDEYVDDYGGGFIPD
ncbi:DNA repair protein [Phlyctema vagabunda]|uniref:DNA repair protein n=1 Tax=Phlyctema vagabunda TaxID=108571 RepID=A0ABR4PEX4_9HELO